MKIKTGATMMMARTGNAQVHGEMSDISPNMTAIPVINMYNNASNNPSINLRRRSKRKSVPQKMQFHFAQIHAVQNHRFAPTGLPQAGQQ
jgi:hypothetical protein